ncbi:MAG: adenylate/guanylate cyclase domain-containing protein [Candidatus Riflebacteria bacterium]|nr:adenylate/guanylate cyclase domain-containing protein [Candidatus Riflebacteria bacterium]
MNSRVLTIVFTDIKGFTERTANSPRDFSLKIREKHDQLLKPIIKKYEGTLIKTIGDAFLLTFESPTNAVLCALMIQASLYEHNANVPKEEKIEIRIAINTGEVNIVDGDILGEPVNIASRVEGITEGGEIWFTESTYLSMNKSEVPNAFIGEFRLKGIPEVMKVYRVVMDHDSEVFKKILSTQQQLFSHTASSSKSLFFNFASAIGIVLVAIILGLGIFWGHGKWVLENFRSNAKKHLENKQYSEALMETEKILEAATIDEQVTEMLNNSIKGAVEDLLKNNETSKARDFLKQIAERHPNLFFPKLEASITIKEAYNLLEKGDSKEAIKLLDEVQKKFETDSFAMIEIWHFYNKSGIHWSKELKAVQTVALASPALLLNDPVLYKSLDYFLRKVAPWEGFEKLRTFISENLFDKYKSMLENSLKSDNSEDQTLRWNARLILTSKGYHVDDLKFYLSEFLLKRSDFDSPGFQESFEFFSRKMQEGPKPEFLKELPAQIATFPILDVELLATDSKKFILIQKLFEPSLKKFLMASLLNKEEHVRRINAYSILAQKPIPIYLETAFHLTNLTAWLENWVPNDIFPYLARSAEFFAKMSGPLSASPQAIEKDVASILGDLKNQEVLSKKITQTLNKMEIAISKLLKQLKDESETNYIRFFEKLQTTVKKAISVQKKP